MTLADQSAIAVSQIRKAYGPTVALSDASFAAATGTVHALLGENGAGKSTMVKMLSGLVQPDQGQIAIFGQDVHFASPRDAHRAGLATAFQELTQVPDLTVWENMLLPYQPIGMTGLLKRRQGQAQVAAHLESLGLGQVSPRAEIRRFDLAVRQKIEIARALMRKPRILLLDEPTSALSGDDIDWLGDIIARLKAAGTTILFISHRMPEVRAFCDDLTILRNGQSVGTFAVSAVSDAEVIERIIGRSIAATFPPKCLAAEAAQIVLEARGLGGGEMKAADLTLRAGEILGVAGLQGMGQRDLFLTLFGDIEARTGEILVDGKPVTLRSPRDAIDARIGINLVPEERKTEGLFLKLDGCANTTLPVIERFTRAGFIDVAGERAAVSAALARVQVDLWALYRPARSFSGGNQQKIVLARSLVAGSRILLLFDPTRGVDVGTKHQIYQLIAEFAAAGGAVLLYSTEIAEVIGLSHRVMVVYGGRIAGELRGQDITEAAIMAAALGHRDDAPSAQPETHPRVGAFA
ncbi:sugar ABC transporter ATP-binding protein [Acidisoma cellulosilytica]|uniref:Sugar ABC transporter ATP-binding protein n=1 Tax=Acidisoma cellulosilyticum TaxID=2802395 RepID=A0A963Z880_9PROT|nr:sugar ABC transporter ATP-binding protein [Acidisoma cellulosilyticum]MCB8883865.1 sugar ABC transporter ATP-binding protein [Acidisoma cellulosilyticum]